MDQRTNYCNIPLSIENKIGRNLHLQKNHPVEIIKRKLFDYFKDFTHIDNLSPFVSVQDNFDKLLIPKDHPARSKSDTYYVNENTVLRTHTSAHQNQYLSQGISNFLIVGDVYRKDEVDKTHYPVFHQMEGVGKVPEGVEPTDELFRVLNGLVEYLFPNCKYRVNKDYFPFTEPSFEYEVEYNGNWLEILGCGIVHKDILKNNNLDGEFWAWGIGLERLVMVMFEIPDIRYLWSTHDRFLEQFTSGEIIKFKPYSELPMMHKDISFWIPNENNEWLQNKNNEWLLENDFFEIAREKLGDWAEEVKLVSQFFHPKKQMLSRTYRTVFSPIDPSLTNPAEFTEICNNKQLEFREQVAKTLNVELR